MRGERIQNFFQGYLAAPIVFICYVTFKVYKRTHYKRISDIDLVTGVREMNVQQLIAEERAERAQWPTWKKYWNVIC